MRKLFLALALCFISSGAWAQCNGVFPATTVCGNLGPLPAPPHAITATTSIFGPGTATTSGDIPYWSNQTGTQLADTGVPIFPIKIYGAPCNGTGDDEPAITSAILSASVAAQGRQAEVLLCKTVYTSETVANPYSNVKVVGLGSGFNSGNCNNAGTTWTWGGVSGAAIYSLITPSNGTTNTSINGGIEGVCLNGGGIAGYGIEVISRYGFRLYDISTTAFTSPSIYFTTQATSATTFGNQAGDVSFIYCAQTSTAPCMNLDGVFGFGNTSINDWHDIQCSIVNGNCIEFHNSDTNIIRHVRAFASGTGAPVKFFGSAINGAQSNYNIVEGLSGNNAALFDNQSAFPSTLNSILWLDQGNANPVPQLTGGGNVTLPYGYYSYNSSELATINGCPTPYSGSNNTFQFGCAISIQGTAWSYFSYSAAGINPLPNNGVYALADNFSNGNAEVDEVNTFLTAIKSFQHYQMTAPTSMYLEDTLTTSGYVVNGTITTSGYTIAGLPACGAGYLGASAYVTNGVSPVTYNATLVATGTTPQPVFCNGTNWTYH